MTTPTTLPLGDAIAAVLQAVADTVDEARDDGPLAELTEVVTSDVARARPHPPYLQVLAGGCTPSQVRALHETWELAVMLTVTLQSEDPLDHWNDAIVLAAHAATVVLSSDRQLGLAYVEDTQPGSVEAIGQTPGQRRLFRAYSRLDVRITIVNGATP